ncbi:hypothetical protein [Streptomyces asiaticus]|uniref:hypothetical protein n=1 Tax=Streptomyces asiaticus TaxID=114695 RepID=UPI0038115BA4
MTNDELRASALYQDLKNLSPDDGKVAARATIRLADGRYVGDVLLSPRDLEALNIALPSLADYARDMEDETDPDLTPGAVEQLHPDALAEVEEMFASLDLGDTDGGTA